MFFWIKRYPHLLLDYCVPTKKLRINQQFALNCILCEGLSFRTNKHIGQNQTDEVTGLNNGFDFCD